MVLAEASVLYIYIDNSLKLLFSIKNIQIYVLKNVIGANLTPK